MRRRRHRGYSENRVLSRLPLFLFSFGDTRLPATTRLRLSGQAPPCGIDYRFLDDRVDAGKQPQRFAQSFNCAATPIELERFCDQLSLARFVPVFVEIER